MQGYNFDCAKKTSYPLCSYAWRARTCALMPGVNWRAWSCHSGCMLLPNMNSLTDAKQIIYESNLNYYYCCETVGRLVVRNDSEDFTSLFTMMTVSPRAHSGSDQRVNLLFSHILPASTGVHRRHRATGRSREGRTAAGRRWAALYRRRASKGQIPQTGAGADDQRCPQRPSHAHGPQETGDVRWVLLLNHQLHISVRALEV